MPDNKFSRRVPVMLDLGVGALAIGRACGPTLLRRNLLACTTWFHQSQVYQLSCTKLIYAKLICTKPHLYHPPKMVSSTRVSLRSRAIQAPGHDFQKSFSLFSIVPGPRR